MFYSNQVLLRLVVSGRYYVNFARQFILIISNVRSLPNTKTVMTANTGRLEFGRGIPVR
jgi:hypothetical protein